MSAPALPAGCPSADEWLPGGSLPLATHGRDSNELRGRVPVEVMFNPNWWRKECTSVLEDRADHPCFCS